jgi:hypothetical protein
VEELTIDRDLELEPELPVRKTPHLLAPVPLPLAHIGCRFGLKLDLDLRSLARRVNPE